MIVTVRLPSGSGLEIFVGCAAEGRRVDYGFLLSLKFFPSDLPMTNPSCVRGVLYSCIALAVNLNLSAQVVINEIMYHPQHAEQTVEPVAEEFLELHNTGGAPVNLVGWQFDAGVGFTFPPVVVPAGAYLVVAADPIAFAAKYPSVAVPVVGPWGGRLSNSGERVRLSDAGGNTVDEIEYTDDGDWAQRRRGELDSGHRGWVWESAADGAGSSLELMNPALTNKVGQNWAASSAVGGTPGESNSMATTNIAPMLREVKHSPAVPSASDFVRVRARLTDESVNGLSAQVHFRVSSLHLLPSPCCRCSTTVCTMTAKRATSSLPPTCRRTQMGR